MAVDWVVDWQLALVVTICLFLYPNISEQFVMSNSHFLGLLFGV